MKICAVVPSYKVKKHINRVLLDLCEYVDCIIVVDDECPENSGKSIEHNEDLDKKLHIVFLKKNQGVGGAVIAGYREGIALGYDIFVKIDGDGQMNPSFIPILIEPIIKKEADYTKGNRFFNLPSLKSMPKIRIIGNAILSFWSKTTTGYWNIMDPTNGYTAIHKNTLSWIDLDSVEKRYFFETDMLYNLGLIRAVVMDIPMPALYGDEVSNLNIRRIILDFSLKHFRKFLNRIFYSYFIRGFGIGSLYILLALPFLIFSFIFGSIWWYNSWVTGEAATSGTVMLAALTAILGIQFLIAFFSVDLSNLPVKPVCNMGVSPFAKTDSIFSKKEVEDV